jgi:hypothetical protein
MCPRPSSRFISFHVGKSMRFEDLSFLHTSPSRTLPVGRDESGTLAIASVPRSPPARPIRITQRVHLSSLLSYSQSPSLAMLLLIPDISMDSCSGRLILTCTRFKVFGFNQKKRLKVILHLIIYYPATPKNTFFCTITTSCRIRCCSCSREVQTGR